MGEIKVQCHNPGLPLVPGRLLLSLSSDKIPKKGIEKRSQSIF